MLIVVINRNLFLQQAEPAREHETVVLRGHDGRLAVASYGNRIHFQLPAQVVEADQVCLDVRGWQEILVHLTMAAEDEVELRLRGMETD